VGARSSVRSGLRVVGRLCAAAGPCRRCRLPRRRGTLTRSGLGRSAPPPVLRDPAALADRRRVRLRAKARAAECPRVRGRGGGGPFSQVRASLRQRHMRIRVFRSPTRCCRSRRAGRRWCDGPLVCARALGRAWWPVAVAADGPTPVLAGNLAAQRDRGGHYPAHLPAPLGNKRSADAPAQDGTPHRPRANGVNPSCDRRPRQPDGADPGAAQLLLEDL
jgi:hypothetical protein